MKHNKAESIRPELDSLDAAWGPLNHRLVRITMGEWAWTCPTCQRDVIYSPMLETHLEECCREAVVRQFGGDGWWDSIRKVLDADDEPASGAGKPPKRKTGRGSRF